MLRVEEDFEELFTPYVQAADYFYNPVNITLLDFSYTNFNVTNRTVDLAFKFEDPFDYGLNTGKSDYVQMYLNETYPWLEIFSENVTVPEGVPL